MPAAPARSQQASAARAMAGSHPGWVRADRGRVRSLPTGTGPEQATGRAAGSQPLDHRWGAGVGGGPVAYLAVGVEAPALGHLTAVQRARRRPHAQAYRRAVGEERAAAHRDRGVTLAPHRAVAQLPVAVVAPAVDLGRDQ